MMNPVSRRRFALQTMTAGGGLMFGNLLPAGFTAAAGGGPSAAGDVVALRPEIEPLVRLIEDTPRQRLLEEIGVRIRSGLSYHDLLAGLFLAGVRNVQPRPSVGFKFHAVLVVNSAHIASLHSADQDRWLPIFWALDEFKSSQARDVRENDWTMAPVDPAAVPAAGAVRSTFNEAMMTWDEARADGAAAGVARCLGAGEALELYAAWVARDFRSIGHKIIFLANAWRTLQTIGWEHSEPVLRSLAYAMLNHTGDPNPADSDLDADRPWRNNQPIVDTIRDDWQEGTVDDAATEEFLSTLRSGSERDAAELVVQQLNAGISPQSIWDAMHTGAGELLMRQRGIVALHAVTTTNASRFLFDHVASARTRLLLMLQNASFLPLFREAMKGRGRVGDDSVGDLVASGVSNPDEAILEVFRNASDDRLKAAHGVYSYLSSGHDAAEMIRAARRLIFAKGRDSHDYKFSSAALEDYYKVSPSWRDRFLATSIYQLRTAGDRDNGLVDRIRAALS